MNETENTLWIVVYTIATINDDEDPAETANSAVEDLREANKIYGADNGD